MDKTSLKKALLEVKEIENFATESAKRIMEQEFFPKIEKTVRQTLLEVEEKEMQEASEISLDNGASVNVTVSSDGKVTIKSGDENTTAMSAPDVTTTTTSSDAVATTELPSVIAPLPATNLNPTTMTPEEEEELFEIVDDAEETQPEIANDTDPASIETGEEAPTDEAPTEEVPTEETPIDSETPDMGDEQEIGEEPSLEKISTDVEELKAMMEKILAKVGEKEPEGEVDIVDDATGEEGGDEEVSIDEPGTEDGEEVEISDDEPGEEDMATDGDEEVEEAPADEEEEVFYEFEDVLDSDKNKDLQELRTMMSELEGLEASLNNNDAQPAVQEEEEMIDVKDLEEALREVLGDDSIEESGDEKVTVQDALNEDDDSEEIEENSSISLTNRQSQNLKPNTPHKKVRTGLKESDKAQYESKLDGLIKENESLKKAIKEYKGSLVIVRKQIDEVQTFNAKLAFANSVFTKGGLTKEEKETISEQFDSCKNAEEARALYNKLIKENVSVSKPGVNKIKLPKAASTNTFSEKGVLYESDETKRMKKLAGIIK